jgi:ATP-dependent protease ClpP protease subunit
LRQVKAVVLRINSPGGSAVASDMIAREVQLLRDAGKPVVAVMGDVAASGSYYIAGVQRCQRWQRAWGAARHWHACCCGARAES